AVARATAEALGGFRERAGVAAEPLATRGRAATQLLALRRELHQMGRLRARLLSELGEAVYRDDEDATRSARGRLEELYGLAAEREAEMHEVMERTEERLARRRLDVQPTEVAEQPGHAEPPSP